MRRAWRILAATLPVALAECSSEGCAADALEAASLIQTLTAQKADAGEGGRALQETNSTHGHSKVVSIQREATVQSHAQTWSCSSTVQNMGRGINLGNVYDFNQGNRDPAVVKRQVKWAHDQGFGHVRVPVTWDGHFDANSQLTKQVTEVVDYALGLGLHVVLNTHHEHWLKDGYDGSQHYKDQFWNLWTGIAGHFAYKSSRLSFEVLNEPDKAFGSWNGYPHPYDQLAIDRTKEVNGLGYAAIRSIAGNQDRMIFLHPNAMSSIGTAKAVYPSKWSLPGGGKDACVGVTVHTYDPYDFCGENGHSNYYANPKAMKKDLIFKFKDLRDWAFDTDIPVYVGEYGVGRQMDRQWDRNNENVREYYKFVANHFRESGMAVCAWDDPGWFGMYNQQQLGLHKQVVTPYQ